jgi:hypothetical protein
MAAANSNTQQGAVADRFRSVSGGAILRRGG